MDKKDKQTIPKSRYRRKRREFFHNEEREARIKEEQEQHQIQKQKEQAQIRNNEERVKDNLQKARVEKLTHDEHKDGKRKHKRIHHRNGLRNQTANSSIVEEYNREKEQQVEETKAHNNHQQGLDNEAHETKDHPTSYDTDKKHHQDFIDKVLDFIKKHWGKLLVIAAALLVLLLIFSIFQSVKDKETKPDVQTSLKDNKNQISTNKHVTKSMEVANKAIHSVVTVEQLGQDNGAPTVSPNNEIGSGVVYKEVDGFFYVLTNSHVVGKAKDVQVRYGNEQVKGRVLGVDANQDLAVVRIEQTDALTVIDADTKNHPVLAEPILVIGNPLGQDFNRSVSEGIISGLNRDVPLDVDKDQTYDVLLNAFQVDAAVNPGNSGGAVVDQSGKLIGISTVKVTMPNVEGMSFAIPIEHALEVAKLLEKGEDVKYPNTGIQLQNVVELAPSEKEKLKLSKDMTHVVIIRDVKAGEPGDEAGLKVNDVIVKVDDQRVQNSLKYKQLLFAHKNKKKSVKVLVIREGNEKNINLKFK